MTTDSTCVRRRNWLLPALALFAAAVLGACAGGQPRSGLAEASEASDARPLSPALRAELDEGEEALTLGELSEATTSFEQARVLDPLNFAARLGLARVHFAAGRAPEALVILARATGGRPAELPRGAAVLYCQASRAVVEDFIARARSEAALELARARRASALCERDAASLEVSALEAEAEDQLARAQTPQAAAAFVELARIAPERVHAFRRAGALLLSLGPARHREALELLSDGLAAHPDDRELEHLMLRALGVPAAIAADARE